MAPYDEKFKLKWFSNGRMLLMFRERGGFQFYGIVQWIWANLACRDLIHYQNEWRRTVSNLHWKVILEWSQRVDISWAWRVSILWHRPVNLSGFGLSGCNTLKRMALHEKSIAIWKLKSNSRMVALCWCFVRVEGFRFMASSSEFERIWRVGI